jgi:hypothetical protein
MQASISQAGQSSKRTELQELSASTQKELAAIRNECTAANQVVIKQAGDIAALKQCIEDELDLQCG